MKNIILVISLLFITIAHAKGEMKFPVEDKILFLSKQRAVVEYKFLKDVSNLKLNIYPVRQTVIWQKVIEGATSTKKTGDILKLHIEINPDAPGASLVGIEFSGIVDNVVRKGFKSIDFKLQERNSNSLKNIKVDESGQKLRVVPLKDN